MLYGEASERCVLSVGRARRLVVADVSPCPWRLLAVPACTVPRTEILNLSLFDERVLLYVTFRSSVVCARIALRIHACTRVSRVKRQIGKASGRAQTLSTHREPTAPDSSSPSSHSRQGVTTLLHSRHEGSTTKAKGSASHRELGLLGQLPPSRGRQPGQLRQAEASSHKLILPYTSPRPPPSRSSAAKDDLNSR